MFKQISAIAALGCLAAVVVPAQAQYQYFENFETGTMNGWSIWHERWSGGSGVHLGGVEQSGITTESPAFGNIAGFSGINAATMRVGGQNYNGGVYKTIVLPKGPGTYQINGFCGELNHAVNADWAEVHLWEGTMAFSPSVDYSGDVNGSLSNGEMMYKVDSFGAPFNGGTGWDGSMSSTDNNGTTPAGIRSFTTTTGTITILLKTGNTGSPATANSLFDDINITPEPSTLLLLALPSVALLRNRRRVAC